MGWPRWALKPAWFARADALHLPAYSLLRAPLSSAALAAAAQVRGARRTRVSGPGVARTASRRRGRQRTACGARLRAGRPVRERRRGHCSRWTARRARGCSMSRRSSSSSSDRVAAPSCGVDRASVQYWRSRSRQSLWRPTDTTGAGDAFDAGFLYSLLSGGFDPRRSRRAALLRRAALTAIERRARNC